MSVSNNPEEVSARVVPDSSRSDLEHVNNEYTINLGGPIGGLPQLMFDDGVESTPGVVVEANVEVTSGETHLFDEDSIIQHGDSQDIAHNIGIDEQEHAYSCSHTDDVVAMAQSEVKTEGEEPISKVDLFDIETLSYELQVGYRILTNLLSTSNRCVNKLFLHPVDDSFPETAEYYKKIQKPMWMYKMKDKMEGQEYQNLTEFMADFRLMIENCYRFNGPDNFVSKKAQKLETMMKQKIALLSKDLRDKLSVGSSADDDLLASAGIKRRIRNPNMNIEDPSQELLCQLRRDRKLQEREDRRQKVEDKKAMEQARIQELQDWEDQLIGPEIKELLRTMWELPQIGHFVYLCMESLGLDEEITQYQLERGLARPRECTDFKRLMTCLLSTPHQRKNLKSFMPYSVWNTKLTKCMDQLYKVLSDCHDNHQQACYKLGLDNRAFLMMGKVNPLRKKQFHELRFRKRAWILKSYCDYCLESQPSLQKSIEEVEAMRPNDVREVLLGSDGRGYRYINFPMFTGKDIRIYRHSKHPEPSVKSLNLENWSIIDEKRSASSSRCSTPVNPKSGRGSDPQSSLRARAMLQAAGTKEASPLRDTSRSGSEMADDASLDGQTPSPKPLGKKGNIPKKRKKSSFYLGKRKRLKNGMHKENCTEESIASPLAMKEEEQSMDDNSLANDPAPSVLPILASEGSSHVKPSSSHASMQSPTASNVPLKVEGDLSHNESGGLDMNVTVKSECNDCSSCTSDKADSKLNDSAYKSCDSDLHIKQGSENEENIDHHDKAVLSSPVKKEVLEVGKISKSEPLSNILKNNEVSKQEADGVSPKNLATQAKSVNESVGHSSDGLDDESQTINSSSPMEQKPFLDDVSMKEETKPDPCSLKGDNRDGIVAEDCDISKDASVDSVKSEIVELSDAAPVKLEESDVKEEAGELPAEEDTSDQQQEEEDDTDEEDIPDVGRMELIVESMDEMRQLMDKLANPEPIKRGKRVYPGVIKPCEEDLLANVTRFHEELIKYERSLFNARVNAQIKLRKEIDNYMEPKTEDTKAWESEASQSSVDASEDEEEEEEEAEQPKKEVVESAAAKPVKKSKPKNSTSEILNGAASKLSLMNGDNEDSSDSYELDISSRGRLRKRRVIPNNTEDTGIKKRKNLVQELPASTAPPVTSVQSAPAITQSSGQPLASKTPHILSMLSSGTASPAIKTQLCTSNPNLPGQIVRIINPGGDSCFKMRLGGRQNVILSPQNLANIRFISGAVPKNQVLSSSPQTSHPVIQQLLLNQGRQPVVSTVSKPMPPSCASSDTSVHTSPSSVKGSTPIPSSSVVGVPRSPNVAPPASSAVVVTQVPTAFMSQGGKQVLDLGSLSVTQIQQLVKNQAIQINTGAGNSTTLLLTTGLQQLATTKPGNSAAAPTALQQVRIPSQAAGLTKLDLRGQSPSPLLAVIGKTPRPPTTTIRLPHLLSNKQVSPLTVVSQPASIRTVLNSPLGLGMLRPVTTATLQPNIPHLQAPQVVASATNSAIQVPMVLGQKPTPSPQIISSLIPDASAASSVGAAALNKDNQVILSASNSVKPLASGDAAKQNYISVPLPSLSPYVKKYSSTVTVKTLLENRSTKKLNMDNPALDEANCSPNSDSATKSVKATSTMQQYPVSDISSQLPGDSHVANTSTNIISTLQATSSPSSQIVIEKCTGAGESAVSTCLSKQPCTSSAKPPVCPLTQPLSVDTAIQPLLSSSVQVTLPTVNMKIPSPNTLPSITHNKNSTTIVQSTKVPIPVASTGNYKVEGAWGLGPESKPATSSASLAHAIVPASSYVQGNTNNNNVLASGQAVVVSVDSSGQVNSNNAAAGLKNVMLKLTPPKGGTGQFVQGFMTSRGLVIPQNALLQQQQQQQLQASSNRVILASVPMSAAASQGQSANQLQANQVTGLGARNVLQMGHVQQVLNKPATLQQLHQPASSQVMVASPSPALLANKSSQAVAASQAGNQAIKVMLINPSAVSVGQSVQSSAGKALATNAQNCAGKTLTTNTLAGQSLQTSTPAAELVKQIANSTQVQAVAQQQQVQFNQTSMGLVQQNNSSSSNNFQVVSTSLQSTNPTATQRVVAQNVTQNLPAAVNSQLAAQILSLQQGNKGLQVQAVQPQQQQQQQQTGIVLATKQPTQTLQQASQPSVMTLQLQQFGNIIPRQFSLGNTQLQQQQGQLTAAMQSPLGTKIVQGSPVVQLAVNHQNAANPGSNLMGQPATRLVQVAGQVNPQIQLAGQAGLQGIAQAGGILLQQPAANALMSQQHVSRPQVATNAIQMQLNNSSLQLNTQQLAIHQLKNTPQKVNLQKLPVQGMPGGPGQIQLLINASAATPQAAPSSLALSSAVTKTATVSTMNIPRISTSQVIRALVNPNQAANLSAPPVPVINPNNPLTSVPPSTVQVTDINNAQPQILQVADNNNAQPQILRSQLTSSGQFLLSPVKLAPRAPQPNASPIKLISPGQPVIQTDPGSAQMMASGMGSILPVQGLNKTPIVNATPVTSAKEKIAHMLMSQPVTNLLSANKETVKIPANNQITQSPSKSVGTIYKLGEQKITIGSSPNLTSIKPGIPQLIGNSAFPAKVIPVNSGAVQNHFPADRNTNLVIASASALTNSQADNGINGKFTSPIPPPLATAAADHSRGNMEDKVKPTGNNVQHNGLTTKQTTSSTAPRRNTFSGSESISELKPAQRHLSIDPESNPMTLEQLDEKEAALNLLTFANQSM